jgi:hypothetical protein
VDELPGEAGDVAGVAPHAGRSTLDVCAQEAGAAAARALATHADPATRTGESPLGVRRIVGELKGLGVAVPPTSVRKVLLAADLQPAPVRARSSWRAFLRQQAASALACDFLTVETAFFQRIYVLFSFRLRPDGLSTSPVAQVPMEHGSRGRRGTSSCSSASASRSDS